jgi:MFS family permease
MVRSEVERTDGEWARGWGVVLASLFGIALYGFAPLTVGLLIKPLTAEFGWSRAQVSMTMLITSIGAFAVGPFVGALVDRFGARRVGLAGVAALTGALAMMALAQRAVWTWYALSIVYGVAAQSGNVVVWTKAISSRFDKHRGLALSVALAGLGVANLIGPLIAIRLEAHFGWRGVYVGLGAIGFLVAFTLALFFFYDASDLAARAGGARPHRTAADTGALPGLSLRQALGMRQFWQISLTILVVAGSVGGLMIHLQAMLTDAGLTPGAAALAYSLIFGPFSIVGRVVSGYLLDRFPAPVVSAAAFGLPAMASLLFLNHGAGVGWMLAGAVLSGLSLGAEIHVVSFLTGRYFGMRSYGSIFGISYGFYSIGFGLGPVLAASAYDHFRTYDAFLIASFVGLVLSVVTIRLLGRSPVHSGRPLSAPPLAGGLVN